MTQLEKLTKFITNEIDLDLLWEEESEKYSKVLLKRNLNNYPYASRDYLEPVEREEKVPGKRGKPAFKTSNIRGMYRHFSESLNAVTYFGKSSGRTSSINTRQNKHFKSFLYPGDKSESSGRKIHELMEENNLSEDVIAVEYINTNKFGHIPGLSEFLEQLFIDKDKPLLNFEVRGKGLRL